MPEGWWPRGVTPRPRSGAVAESTRLRRRRNCREELSPRPRSGVGREELPHAPTPEARGGSREEQPHVRGQGQKLGVPHARKAAAKRSYPTSEVRGSGREYQTAMAQGRPRGATPRPRSGRVAVRRYHSSKVRSNGCAFLEQP